MTRTLFHGGTVYDGTAGVPAEADVVVEDGRIVEVGTGLDGDVGVDCTGGFVSPGFFDCHVHVVMDAPSQMQLIETPFSLQFYQAAANLKKTLDVGITSVRDAGGADQGIKEAVERGMIPGPRMQIAVIMLSQTGGHGDDWCDLRRRRALLRAAPGPAQRRGRRARRGPQARARDHPRRAPTSSRWRRPAACSARATTRGTRSSATTRSPR